MKLVIIGNGFDLHHGLDISFKSFRNYLKENNNNLAITIDRIIKEIRKNIDIDNIELAWNEIEEIFYEKYRLISRDFNKLNNLEDIFENFNSEFYSYIIKKSNKEFNENNNISELLHDADAILVFNYTQTYEIYLKNITPEIFHIHGSISEDFFPVIGYYSNNIHDTGSKDYREKFNNHILHKPAVAYKQNIVDLETNINKFIHQFEKKIDEVISIGFSFGKSDNHIYRILNTLLIEQKHSKNMNYDEAESIQKVFFRIFSYDENETDKIISEINFNFIRMFGRNIEVYKTGRSIKREIEPLICFEKVYY